MGQPVWKNVGLARGFLLFSTILFMVVGVTLLGIGVWLRVDPTITVYFQIAAAQHNIGELFGNACTYMATVGSIVLVIGLVGFYGVLTKNTWALNGFAGLVIVVAILQIVLAIIAGAYSTRLGPELQAAMTRQVTRHYDGISQLSHAWDYMQVHLECCAADKVSEWSLSWWEKPDGYQTPRSCCKLIVKDHHLLGNDSNIADPPGCRALIPGAYHEQGCFPKLRDWMYQTAILVMVLALCLKLVLVLTIVASCWLRLRVQSEKVPPSPVEMHQVHYPQKPPPLPLQQRGRFGIQNRYSMRV